LFSKEFQVL